MRQSKRQTARRTALDAVSRARHERVQRDDRIAAAAVDVLTALAERDAAVTVCEARAGAALRTIVEVEGLSMAEAVQWLDDQLTVKEATRMRAAVVVVNQDQGESQNATVATPERSPGEPAGAEAPSA